MNTQSTKNGGKSLAYHREMALLNEIAGLHKEIEELNALHKIELESLEQSKDREIERYREIAAQAKESRRKYVHKHEQELDDAKCWAAFAVLMTALLYALAIFA